MLRLLTAAILALSALLAARAQTAADLFLSAPEQVVLIDSVGRLDMLDYYRSGSMTPTRNVAEGRSRVTAETERSLRFVHSDCVEYELCVVPGAKEPLALLIETLPGLVADAQVSLFTAAWQPAPKGLMPALKLRDWLTARGRRQRAEVEQRLPFLAWTAHYDPDALTLTLRLSVLDYFTPADRAALEPLLRPELTLKWNGKKFVKQ